MSRTSSRWTLLPALAMGLVITAGCVDEKIVFQNRELFEEPLEGALGFVGYTSADDKLTVCGNCHVGPQGEWEGTAHADAWAGLQDSGHAQPFCEGCHTVSELGNSVTAAAGYNTVAEARYEDVQCESCHGPGLNGTLAIPGHVESPEDANVPMAAMDLGDILADEGIGCAECHSGDHHPFAEEWAASGHGEVISYPAGRVGCESCHTGEGALEMFGVNTVFAEQETVAQDDEHLAITCAVCHDPHGSDNVAQLRFPIDEPDTEENLCTQCHQKRGVPDEGSFRGPHSPEGPTLFGTAGWRPTYLTAPILSTHGSVTENPNLCAGCHVNSYTVTDMVTGDFVFSATGHRFEATPCVDALGVPVDGPCANSEKSYEACTDCHSAEVAEQLVDDAEASIALLIADLQALVDDAELNHPGEFETDDNFISVAEGAKFNLGLAETPGAIVHNAFLVRRLLIASIDEMMAAYP